MTIINRKRIIFYSLGSLLLTSLLVCYLNTDLRLKIYKFWYVRYVRITKSELGSRFSDTELSKAIRHARQQHWVQQQIRADLAPYRLGITQRQINHWFETFYQEDNQLVKFTIRGNKVSYELPKKLQAKRSFRTIHDVLTLLANKWLLPDCTFVVVLQDYLAFVPANEKQPAAVFSFAKDLTIPVENTSILIPDWMNIRYWDVLRGRIDYASKTFPWDKKKNLIHWRGGLADSMSHRHKLVALTSELPFLDVGLTEGVNNAPYVDPEFSLKNKYQVSLDGARCTWERMVWQLHSNAVLIKPQSPQVQWFHRGLTPYQHYIPVKDINKESIESIYAWLITNDNKVKEINANANNFAQENLKTVDFLAYFVVLLEEYAKLCV